MKKGILVYTEQDANLNKWFISHLSDELNKFDVKLNLYITENEEKFPNDIDFCINRSRFYEINELLENKGVLCFNNGKTIKTANDKWLTYLLCKELEIPVMKTKLLEQGEDIDFPAVVKSRNGHGGSEVMLIESKKHLKNEKLKNTSGYILQEKCSTSGVDVRVYVLGGEIFAAVKRTSETDFRSNFSLGGNVELFTPEKEQIDVIKKLNKKLCTDYAGFDFIMHNGIWILNEIEDAVGARMLYSLTDTDIVGRYAEYIAERVDKNA